MRLEVEVLKQQDLHTSACGICASYCRKIDEWLVLSASSLEDLELRGRFKTPCELRHLVFVSDGFSLAFGWSVYSVDTTFQAEDPFPRGFCAFQVLSDPGNAILIPASPTPAPDSP